MLSLAPTLEVETPRGAEEGLNGYDSDGCRVEFIRPLVLAGSNEFDPTKPDGALAGVSMPGYHGEHPSPSLHPHLKIRPRDVVRHDAQERWNDLSCA